MKEFVNSHWRDVVGLLVLYTGVSVSLLSPELNEGLGMPLIVSGLAMLKLKTSE